MEELTLSIPTQDLHFLEELASRMGWLFKTGASSASKTEQDEYISKNEVLEGIRSGLQDIKNNDVRPIEELFKEL